MDTIVPMQYITAHFSTPIKKLHQIYHSGHCTYYDAITTYGSLTLVVQNYAGSIHELPTVQFLHTRNQLMKENTSLFPVVYEQEILVNHPEQIACISLMERCYVLGKQGDKDKIGVASLAKLVNCMILLGKYGLGLSGGLEKGQLLYFQNQGDIGFDFSKIAPKSPKQKDTTLQPLIKTIQSLITLSQMQQNQFIILQQKIYKINTQVLAKAGDILELAIMLNICKEFQVQVELKNLVKSKSMEKVQSPSKPRYKKVQLQEMHGREAFKVQDDWYDLTFLEGTCTNALEQIDQNGEIMQKLRKKRHFRLTKRQHIYLQIINMEVEEQLIIVQEPVQKIQFISFIITYLKLKTPVITGLTFLRQTNSLKIHYTNKNGHENVVEIVFYPTYIVKDEEVSMILERGKLKGCRLDLRYMRINDTLLMFLANSEKTAKITEIHLSDCYGITDSGINILMMSPFCKKAQAFSLILDHKLFESSLQSLSLKSQLKKLHLQSNKKFGLHEHQVQINLNQLKIGHLCVFGIKINMEYLDFGALKILKLTQPIQIDDLKLLKNAQLTELKIRLIDLGKKSLLESTSSLISGALIHKNNPVRAFAQGPSSKTLKSLDLSNSSIKLKTIKYLFTMPQLQKLVLNNCSHLGHQFEPISQKILHLSLMGTQIAIAGLHDFIDKTSIIVELNLIGNESISKEELVKFIQGKKKFINNLLVCQNLYSNKLIERIIGNGGFQLVQNVGLYACNLIDHQNDEILFEILKKVMETPKTLKLLTQLNDHRHSEGINQINQRARKLQKLMQKIKRFVEGSGKGEKPFKNLIVNNLHYHDAYDKQRIRRQLIPQEKLKILTVSQSKMKLNVLQSVSISKLRNIFSKLPTSVNSLSINLRNNKILDKNVMQMLQKHVGHLLSQIDFTNCIFKVDDVIENLFQLPMLTSLNNGSGSLDMDSTNFSILSQKYLKFYMKLMELRDFSIKCAEIEEAQILYSVLYHIIDKHSQCLLKLSVKLRNLSINYDGEIFVTKICDLPNLHDLTIDLEGCTLAKNGHKKQNTFDGLNKLSKLKRLKLKLPSSNFPALNFRHLQHFSIGFSDDQIAQNDFNKIIKHIQVSPIQNFQIDLSNCPHITSPTKLFSLGPNSNLLQKLHSLTKLSINLEYCPLKQNSLHELLHWISKSPHIKNIEFNTSFAVSNLNQLANKVNLMVMELDREVTVNFVCVTANSSQFTFNRQFFQANGVYFIF